MFWIDFKLNSILNRPNNAQTWVRCVTCCCWGGWVWGLSVSSGPGAPGSLGGPWAPTKTLMGHLNTRLHTTMLSNTYLNSTGIIGFLIGFLLDCSSFFKWIYFNRSQKYFKSIFKNRFPENIFAKTGFKIYSKIVRSVS